ncbi:MAG: GvpL/GvpF family gas vesicle protein [bacterium]
MTVNDAHMAQVGADTEIIVVRDLAAICGRTEYHRAELGDDAVMRQSDVVAAFGARGPVLPAPVGVVFRAADSVVRWLELHYSALTDALTFVENRVGARVHISRIDVNDSSVPAVTGGEDRRARRDVNLPPEVDVDAAAAESLRILRTSAVATIPLRADRAAGVLLSAAFLVEQDQWQQFRGEVDAQAKLTTAVRFELTGPWPPYDFVQMQLGA